MSLSIIPYPIDTAMAAAMAAEPGIHYAVKYIRVGKGLQSISLDDAGRATTQDLKDPVGYLEILNAEQLSPYQWQIAINVKQAHTGTDFNFSEFTLCDADKNPIAIYGSPTQALYAVTEVLDNAILAVNLVFAAFPADSITIVHQNLPLKLFMTQEIAAMEGAIGRMTLQHMRDINRRLAQEKLQQQQDNETQAALAALRMLITGNTANQRQFNITTEQAIGRLSVGLMQGVSG